MPKADPSTGHSFVYDGTTLNTHTLVLAATSKSVHLQKVSIGGAGAAKMTLGRASSVSGGTPTTAPTVLNHELTVAHTAVLVQYSAGPTTTPVPIRTFVSPNTSTVSQAVVEYDLTCGATQDVKITAGQSLVFTFSAAAALVVNFTWREQ